MDRTTIHIYAYILYIILNIYLNVLNIYIYIQYTVYILYINNDGSTGGNAACNYR